jgi:hypothetical protein
MVASHIPPAVCSAVMAIDIQEMTVAPQVSHREFNATDLLDAFQESSSQFEARLKRSNLEKVTVPGNGECFWSASLKGLNWICQRNLLYANSIQNPATPREMRNQILDYVLSNLDTEWAEKDDYLDAVCSFRALIRDEIPFGVLNGRTGRTDVPADIDDWFVLMRDHHAYTSSVCVVATALYFRVSLKVFIRGSSTETYVPRKELHQEAEEIHIVVPDSTICLCKNDRRGHFDACRYVPPALFVPNRATKTGRGRAQQARIKSSTEQKKKKKK